MKSFFKESSKLRLELLDKAFENRLKLEKRNPHCLKCGVRHYGKIDPSFDQRSYGATGNLTESLKSLGEVHRLYSAISQWTGITHWLS